VIVLPEKLEFGNIEHIKAVRAAEKEIFIRDHKEELIKKYWKDHDSECYACGHSRSHCGDTPPEIKLEKNEKGDLIIKMICREGDGCDEMVEINFKDFK
jgi:hypothetical protein